MMFSDYENQILIQFEYGLNPVLAPAVRQEMKLC